MEQDFNLEQTLISFNQDPNFIELRERYSTRSFLEIMSVERSENRHSSFLAWLLGAKDFAVNPKDHPIVHLLDILIRRMGEQNNNIHLPEGIKPAILSRDIIEVNLEEITTEKAVQDVAISDVDEYKKHIQDRLDIYIKGEIVTSVDKKPFEIIIENKIGSTEGGEKSNNKENASDSEDWKKYYKSSQTNRYYTACHSGNRIFVFLTPITSSELNKFESISNDKKSGNENFININYQDILDEIIEPLLANQNLSSRVRVLLEEYVLSLSLPGIYTNDEDNKKKKNNKDKNSIKTAIIMAERKHDVIKINELLNNNEYHYKKLIISAAKCLAIEDEIVKTEDNKTAKKNAKESIKTLILAALEFQPEENKEEGAYKLLLSFGKTYKNLLIALLKTYVENYKDKDTSEEFSIIKDAYQNLLGKPKDRSEFTVIDENGVKIMDEEVKRSFAKFIIEKYIEYYNNNSHVDNPLTYFENIKEMYPLCPNPNDSTRYFPKSINIINVGDYFISNQWGITRDQREDGLKDEHFDKIFKKVFGEQLYKLDDGKDYSNKPANNEKELKLHGVWKEILSNYTIKVKRIYK